MSDVVYQKLVPAPKHPRWHCPPPEHGVQLLRQGHTRFEGQRPFGSDIVFERDATITLRDGVKLYTDIFRPASSDDTPVPVIIPWSPYGKTGTGALDYDRIPPFRAGIEKSRTSGYEKFEAPDPSEWCDRGYATLSVDARGSGNSEGNLSWWGTQEAEDVYDAIDWVCTQPWCSGSVAMAGNSWLAVSQANFAARLSHPALKAIAPWEGKIDLYRDQLARGGRPHLKAFHGMMMHGFAGPGSAEDIVTMIKRRPLFDDYWEDKRIPVEKIEIPLYVVASYASMLHTHGSFHTFQHAKSKMKWLRVHPYFEWYDLYRVDMNDDLQKFFDRYCKGEDNGWERTPPVRLSLLAFHSSPARTIIERPENEYPLAREQMHTFYLNAQNRRLELDPVSDQSMASYEAHSMTASVDFKMYFDKYTEIAGYSKLEVYASCDDHDDLDIAVQIRKINAQGHPLEHVNYPVPVPFGEIPGINIVKYKGPEGFIRASHAISLDREASSGNDLFYSHRVRQPVPPGTIARLEIPIWPTGMVFEAGEGIMLCVSGHDFNYPETAACIITEPDDDNVGTHKIHTGGQYRSTLTLPFIST